MSRLLMILDFLKGEKGAQAILADMIEEEGDEYLSQLVRSRNPTTKKFLQLGLEVVPFPLAIEIVIDYYMDIVGCESNHPALSMNPSSRNLEEQFRVLKTQIGLIRAWIKTIQSVVDRPERDEYVEVERQLKAECKALRKLFFDLLSVLSISRAARARHFLVTRIDQATNSLVDSIEIANLLVVAEYDSDRYKAKRSNNRLRTSLVKMATVLRFLACAIGSQIENQNATQSMILEWQWQYLIKKVERTVHEAVD